MSRLFFFKSRSFCRAVFSVAGAWLLVTGVGCSSEEPANSQNSAYHNNNGADTNSAVTASARTQAPSEGTVSMAFPTGNRATSDLWIEEVLPREPQAGRACTYEIRVTNLRDIPMTGVVLGQRVPEFLKVSNANESPNAPQGEVKAEGHVIRIDIGDLGPHETKTVQMTGTPAEKGTIRTCLSARYNPPSLCAAVEVVAPAISAIAEGPSRADVCEDLVYKFTVTNTGTGTTHNVVLEGALPEGLTTADNQKAISAQVGDLRAGESKSVTVHLRSAQPGTFTMQAIARSDDAGQVKTQAVTTVLLAPRLAVTVAGPKQDFVGRQITYQVTVKNNGDGPAMDTKVRVGATPGMVDFVSAQNADGSQISQEREGTGQNLGTIAPGEARTVSLTFNTRQEGELSLDATAETRCGLPVTTPIRTLIQNITAAALHVSHDPDPVRVGSNVVYHITIENKGTAADRNIAVVATLPASEEFVRASGESNATNDKQTITFGPISVLQPKQSVSWNVEAKAIRADEAQFKASMTSESTPKAAIKVEPTKLYDHQTNVHEKTNEAPAAAPINTPGAAPVTPPAQTPGK